MQNFLIISVKNSSTTISDPVEIADKFNEYFAQIGPQLAKKIPNDNSMSYKNYLQCKYVESIFIEPVNANELLTEILNLKEHKSAGYDEMNATIVKSIANEIVEPLTYIYNLSFSTRTIPSFLKISLVTPIF